MFKSGHGDRRNTIIQEFVKAYHINSNKRPCGKNLLLQEQIVSSKIPHPSPAEKGSFL